MKKISPTAAVLITLIITVITLGALYGYFFSSLSQMGQDQIAFRGEIKDAGRALEEEGKNREMLERYFIIDGEQAIFVSSLESACESLALSCQTRSLTETTDTSGSVKVLSLVISAQGTFANIEALIRHFEASRHAIQIDRSALSSKQEEQTASSTVEEWEGIFDLTVPVMVKK